MMRAQILSAARGVIERLGRSPIVSPLLGTVPLTWRAAGRSQAANIGTADPKFPDSWIGQRFNLVDTLPQFIERAHAWPEQRAAVDRRLNTFRGAVKEPRANRMLTASYAYECGVTRSNLFERGRCAR
jgi:hypothetical protein